jgi:hypothetical protein
LQAAIPKLYETENIPNEQKTICQTYVHFAAGFYWLIAELDPKQNLAYGYANLNDDLFAEWGYISIDELRENRALEITDWKPATFQEAKQRVKEILEQTTQVA